MQFSHRPPESGDPDLVLALVVPSIVFGGAIALGRFADRFLP